eukprot:COSAG02_NODE_42119_length_387_cov_1.604167_1_plen_31_part_10
MAGAFVYIMRSALPNQPNGYVKKLSDMCSSV